MCERHTEEACVGVCCVCVRESLETNEPLSLDARTFTPSLEECTIHKRGGCPQTGDDLFGG